MKDVDLDESIKKILSQQANIQSSSNFTDKLMKKIYLEQVRLNNEVNVNQILLIILGLVTGWVVVLSSLWQTQFVQESWLTIAPYFDLINIRYVKYVVGALALHALLIRVILGLPLVLRNKLNLRF
ncbi:MAG: hypothetical protein JXQ90_00505 [Cyclobacteriaceae bacterium]